MTDPDRIVAIVRAAMRFKKSMLEHGKTEASGRCPFCKGRWHGRLEGKRNLIRVACDTCDAQMIE